MLRDITLGQYYMTDSIIHRLDPRTKLFGTLAFVVSLFLAKSIWGYALALFFLILAIVLCKVPVKFMLKGMKTIMLLLLITVLFNLFLTPGQEIFRFKIITITKEGVILASQMASRLVLLIIGSGIMTLTTTPNRLTDGLEKSLNPLKRFHIPVHEIAMMMTIALRFIPILMEETDKIMKAQMARGADFESGNIIKRAKALVPILVPLFVSAFRRANDLALAMESRCYKGGDGRTKMKPLVYSKADFLSYGCIVLFLVGSIILRIIK